MSSSQNSASLADFTTVADMFLELDRLIQDVSKGRMAGLGPINLRSPPSQPAIHAFYTMVSWLYVRVIECGPVHFRFLSERALALGIDPSNDLKLFREDMQIFRTVLQHNLNLAEADDLAKLVRCENWIMETLEKRGQGGERFWPIDQEEWHSLAEALQKRAKRFVELNLSTVKRMVSDEFADNVIEEWIRRSNRSLPAHQFDSIAAQAAGDLGLSHLDVTRLRKVHLDEWNHRLRLLSERADILREARRLVEQTLLTEAETYLPIDGQDVIQLLGIKPGPEVGKTLRMAKEIYSKSPCSRDILLKQLGFSQADPPSVI